MRLLRQITVVEFAGRSSREPLDSIPHNLPISSAKSFLLLILQIPRPEPLLASQR